MFRVFPYFCNIFISILYHQITYTEVRFMKRIVLLFAVLFGFMSSGVFAQDDMYFTPKKEDKAEPERQYVDTDNAVGTYYNYGYRDVDEYNRRGRFAENYLGQGLDSLYSDVIVLDSVASDSLLADTAFVSDDFDYAYNPEDDYTYSRRMSRYDDYYWYDPWIYGGWYGSPYWYGSYWYGSPYWYAGWWYDPWYDPWFYGWHRPWGWYYPVYSYYRPYRGVTGTTNHGRPYGHHGTANNFRGYRGNNSTTRGNSSFTGNRYSTGRNTTNYNNRFRGNRQNTYNNYNNTPSRSTFNNSGSFGGSRSGGFHGGGSFGGGSRGGGGGGGFRGRR